MKPPRGLTGEEAAAWARLAATVKPIAGKVPPRGGDGDRPSEGGGTIDTMAISPPCRGGAGGGGSQISRDRSPPPNPPPNGGGPRGLDSTWDRKLARGTLEPEFTLDLHGHTLDAAHARLDQGLVQAKALGARVVLLITGKPRPVEAADRGSRRGAIRAKVLDWLAAGPHGSDIAAVRSAHRKHGGEGALYLVLKRRR
jgi:hypothetical protein